MYLLLISLVRWHLCLVLLPMCNACWYFSFFRSSTANPPFWIPIHIVIPERPTECAVFNVIAGILMSLLHLLSLDPSALPFDVFNGKTA